MGNLIKAAKQGAALTKARPEVDPAAAIGRPALLPFDQMQPNPENPRPSDLQLDELCESLKARGQLQNVNVMTRAAFIAQKPYLTEQLTAAPYVVVNGCQRLAVGPKAGLPGLKYEIHDEWTADDIDEALISENEDRYNLNPMLLGRQLFRMLHRPKYGGTPDKPGSQRKLAEALGKQHPWVNQRIGLVKLDPTLQLAIEQGDVPWTIAREAVRLAAELQPKLATGELPHEVAQLWLVKQRIDQDEQLARWKAGPPYTGAADGQAEQAAVTVESETPPERDHAEETSVVGESKPKAPREKPAIVIRIMERSATDLAAALREQLSEEEVSELVTALQS